MKSLIGRSGLAGAVATAVLLAGLSAAGLGNLSVNAAETPAQKDARMKWWREARFGMFVHWGVYSVPAGFYKGQPVGGIGEWIMNSGKIPVAEYREFAHQFNPVKYNPDEWVKLAKAAGMKYIVITSKHHDGFALFDSKASDWNVVRATPYGKDLLKPLAEACRKHGLKLGFYYSQAQDWNNPGGAAAGGHWDKAQEGSMDEYIKKVAVPQVEEILKNYGDIAVLWWDTPVDMTEERARQFLPVIAKYPHLITNNRLGVFPGDTETPEQFIPPTGYGDRDWETCMTLNDTWGFKRDDHNWKSSTTLIRNLVDIASKGGNYLLNVGPTSEGLIPQPSVERLQEVGKWMQTYGDTIYGTSASPFKRLPWGRATRKVDAKGTTLYLHVFDWPADGKLLVPGLKSDVKSARVLGPKKQKAAVSRTTEGVLLQVPAQAPNAVCSVVALQIPGKVEVEPMALTQAADGTMKLAAMDADTHGGIQYESGENRDNLGFWTNPQDWAEWTFQIRQPGKFKVTAEVAAMGTSNLRVAVGSTELKGVVPNTGDYGKFTTISVGTLDLKAGRQQLSVRPVEQGWSAVNLRRITLTPER